MRPILLVARYVLTEALRSGFAWLALACILASAGAAVFAGRIAITETRELQAAAAGALLRLLCAFLIAAHVVASVARETADRGLEFALTLPLSRSQYYLGKLGGFACCAALLATAFALPMLLLAAPAAVAAWGISLALEAALLAAVALCFSLLLEEIVPALAAAAAFYLLGRSISAIQAIASGPLADEREGALGSALDALALLLPRLDRVTRTEWLLHGAPARDEWLSALAGLALYLGIAAAAGLFDFSRRNL